MPISALPMYQNYSLDPADTESKALALYNGRQRHRHGSSRDRPSSLHRSRRQPPSPRSWPFVSRRSTSSSPPPQLPPTRLPAGPTRRSSHTPRRISTRSPSSDEPRSSMTDDGISVPVKKLHKVAFESSDDFSFYQESSQQMTAPNTVECNIAQAVDMTVHLQLETKDEISEDLEEFSRLCRIGHFAAAQQYYIKFLIEYQQNPFVCVHYAQMLYRSGNYKELNAFHPLDRFALFPKGALKREFKTLKRSAQCHAYGPPSLTECAAKFWKTMLEYSNAKDKCAATVIQSLVLSLDIVAYMRRFYTGMEAQIREAFTAVPFAELVERGQIWDYRDVFVSLVCCDPELKVLPSLYDEHGTLGLFDSLTKVWETRPYDEATNLALIDIAESILLSKRRSRDISAVILDRTADMISTLLQHNPDLMLSRQYLRWFVFKSTFEHENTSSVSYSRLPPGSRGIMLEQDHVFSVPIYIPSGFEFLKEEPRKPRLGLIADLEVALEGAKELGDFETQAIFLQALIAEGEDRMRLYDELSNLQKNVQNDSQALLQTYLSQYTLCRNSKDKSSLRKKILAVTESENFPITLCWARAMILRSLSATQSEASFYFKKASKYAAQAGMPQKCSDMMEFTTNSNVSFWSSMLGEETEKAAPIGPEILIVDSDLEKPSYTEKWPDDVRAKSPWTIDKGEHPISLHQPVEENLEDNEKGRTEEYQYSDSRGRMKDTLDSQWRLKRRETATVENASDVEEIS